MRNITKKILICSGLLMILAALSLSAYNVVKDKKAYKNSQVVMSELIQLIPETTAAKPAEILTNPADDLFAPYKEQSDDTEKMPAPITVDGREYCGYISMPALGLKLPVIDNWSYDALNYSPCRFSGTAAGKDLIIAAHNYNSHFGLISKLNNGDDLFFTDTSGTVYSYKVEDIRVLDGSDSEGMFYGKTDEWDITLFTCTLSGQGRVAVRGSIKNGNK